MADKKNISPKKSFIEEDKLIDYLNNNLSDDEAQKMEKELAESDFTKDAMEGLRAFKHPQKLNKNVRRLNKALRHSVQGKTHQRPQAFSQLIWYIVAVILILIIIIACYAVIRLGI